MNKFLPLTTILILSFSVLLIAQEDKATPPGLGEPGVLQSIDIDNVAENQTTIISGRDAGLQLIVTGAYDSGHGKIPCAYAFNTQRGVNFPPAATTPNSFAVRPAGKIVSLSACCQIFSMSEFVGFAM